MAVIQSSPAGSASAQARAGGEGRAVLVIIALIFATPIFVAFKGGVSLAPEYTRTTTNGLVVPLSVLFSAPILVWCLCSNAYSRLRISTLDVLIMTYIALNTASYLFGIASASGIFGDNWFTYYLASNALPSFLAYAQSMIPAVWYVTARLAISNARDGTGYLRGIATFLEVFALLMFLVFILYCGQTALDGGSQIAYSSIADHIGPFYNYKALRFYPLLLSISACVSLACLFFAPLPHWRSVIHGIAAIAEPLAITLMHSRSALLAVGLGYFAAFFWLFEPRIAGISKRAGRFAVIGFLVGCMGLTGLVVIGSRSLERFVVLFEALSNAQDQLQGPDSLKFLRFTQATDAGFSGPLGGAFAQQKGTHVGAEANVTGAESGWLDELVRAGPLNVIIVWLICMVAMFNSFLSRSSDMWNDPRLRPCRWVTTATFLVVLSQAIGANPFINVLDDPYVGPVIWSMLAIATVLPQRSVAFARRRRLRFRW